MSRLIFTWRAVSSGSSAPLPPPPTARSAPVTMDPHMAASGGPAMARASAQASWTSSVTLLPRARRTHRHAWTPDMTSASDATSPGSPLPQWWKGVVPLHDGVGSNPIAKKNTRRPCRQLKMGQVTRVTNDHIMIVYDERHQTATTVE
ncbi:hypothetical protein D8674_011471 [Pyrus ussuriensis x Pyrus communis]|uniref:Uncharacterized protein n=1 Tax=Pyrus ussuriensis x Pyrus communis TaxID=2448454 RepID=A0A5N5FYX1_9ROSA|nr:hypothetical protein D8674_011471 [Pyrus ussuriensis x Pyrus communis]